MKHEIPKGTLAPETPGADVKAFEAFDALSQRCSRRGVLARVGKWFLGAVGAGVVYQTLPIGREFANAAVVSCDSMSLCGFCGFQCGCSDCSGDLGSCPNCACLGGAWSVCCGTFGAGTMYRYLDCYSHGDSTNGPCSQTKINNCRGCRECCRTLYPDDGPYPGGCSGTYMCTRVRQQSGC